MRDPNRIDIVLDAIKTVWKENPDMRLIQLLGTLCQGRTDPFYLEDSQLLLRLEEFKKTKDE